MRRRALLAASGTVLSLVAFVPAAPALRAGPDPMDRLSARGVTWKSCVTKKDRMAKARYRGLECAELETPLDWASPHGPTIELVISRLKARRKAKGVVFTNPGGPGGSGLLMPLQLAEAGRTRLLDNMDVIGIDVRGVGRSTPATCRTVRGRVPDPRDRSAANVKRLLDRMRQHARACQEGGSAKLPSRYITTAQTVHDLEWIRRNLKTSAGRKVERIHWIGYSAGTWLGAHYARRWPRHTGRFVLDSVVDFSGGWHRTFDAWGGGFQKRFHRFADWAARYNELFGLGSSRRAVVRRYERIRAAVVRHGKVTVVSSEGRTALYPADLDVKAASQLYSKTGFAFLAAFLRDLSPLAVGKRTRVESENSPLADATSVESPMLLNILCNDTQFPRDPAQQLAFTARLGRKYPLLGYTHVQSPCAFWERPHHQLELLRPVGDGLPPLLLVHSVGDPATPYSGALRAHRAYRNSRLITVKNEGDHGIYGGDNACVNRIVERYLVDGRYPARDRTCPGTPLPTVIGHNMKRQAASTGPLKEPAFLPRR